MSRKKQTINSLLNDLMFKITYDRFKHLTMNRFEWSGLPKGIEERYIESALFEHGKALFFEDDMLGVMCLPCNPDGGMNVYGDFNRLRAFGLNYEKSFPIDEDSKAILIKNNHSMTNTHDVVMLYTSRLVEIEKTIMLNIKQQKTPYIVACSEKDLLTLKSLYNKVDDNQVVIYADKQLDLNTLGVHLTNAPFVADKLLLHKHEVENEFLTLIGINNANTDKKERLITDEVNSNNEYIHMNVSHMLEVRKLACDEINKKFGLNISVKLRGDDDESIHVDDETTGGE